MIDQSSEPFIGVTASAPALPRTFSISLSDPGFFVASSLPTNRFRLTGKATLSLSADKIIFAASRKRFFLFNDDYQLELPLSSVVNLQRTDKKLRLEFAPDEIDASLITKGAETPFIVLWAANDDEAKQIESLLPKRQTDQYSQEIAEEADFQARLLAATPRAFVTPTLIVLNVLVFLLMLATGAGFMSPNAGVHVVWGSNFGPMTTSGQWWRLFTSTFIHFGFVHLLLNMWALYETGRVTERLYGNFYFFALYVLAGVAGSLASVIWNPQVNSAGASGAIFGVFGAVLAFMLKKENRVPLRVMNKHRNGTYAFIAYSLFYGFSHAGIDNAAHLGGLAAGFLLGLLFARPLDIQSRKARGARFGLGLAGLALVAALPWMTITAPPQNSLAYILRGEERAKQNDYENAAADFDEAIRLNPKAALAYIQRGNLLRKKGDYEKAIGDYAQAIALNPADADGYMQRAATQILKGDQTLAIADLNESIRIKPKAALLYNLRGGVRNGQGEFQSAITDFSQAIKLDPRDAYAYRGRGFANFYDGQFAMSAADFGQSLGLNNKEQASYALIWRYMAQARSGDSGAARTELLAGDAAVDKAKWPAPVIAFFAGQKDASGLLKAAEHTDVVTRAGQICEAEFYIGQWHVLAKRLPEARTMLLRARDTCPKDFTEYQGAVTELKRLGE